MSIDAINIINKPQKYSVIQKNDKNKHLKSYSVLSSAVGTGIALALICKKQGFSLNPKVIFKKKPSDWAIFGIASKKHPERRLLNIEEKEILTLATGSVLGGLAGGALFDKKNMKAKCREAITQIFGNVILPVIFVGGTARLYNKYENQIKDFMPVIKKDTNFVKQVNKFTKNLPAIAMTFTALGLGIFTGSKLTNFINEKFFNQKRARNIKATDFAPHVDDLCLAITLMGSKDSLIASSITKTLPFFLAVPGYQVAKAQEIKN